MNTFQVVTMNMRDGSVQGHAAGCLDTLRAVRKFSDPRQANEHTTVSSKEEARAEYNADFDQETDGWYEIDWLPCADHVPAESKVEESKVEVKRGPKWTYIHVNGVQVMEVRSEFADQVLASVNFFA